MALPVPRGIEPMLARLSDDIPRGEGWLYEPKWDGFRALIYRDGDVVELVSRNGQPLNRYFPELIAPLQAALPPRCVVDGEIVITAGAKLDFEALLLRIHPAASRVTKLARELPASFVAFDLLGLGDDDLRGQPLSKRWPLLKKALRPGAHVWLTPQSDDPDVAQRWLTEFEAQGMDGVVAKRPEQRYEPGERVMVKIKRVHTADCVIGGYRKAQKGTGIGSLLLGIYADDGGLRHVGHTSAFPAKQRQELQALLTPLEGGSGFVEGHAPGGPSRWSRGRDMSWIPVQPKLVCEVAFDRLVNGKFRHAGRFVRWRPDKKPAECTFAQFEKQPRVQRPFWEDASRSAR
ncbi:MAG: ATP-dependent DNA ligase [Myxococcales bacterium]